ncbi:cytochrome P450 [Xylariaceae sp. FL0594]|nr:cytochrome P450 [Xylariaceae sp. FL0594]
MFSVTPLLHPLPTLTYYGLLVLLALRLSFNVLLHPLNKYPGPRFARLSDVYNGYHAFRRQLYLVTWRNHKVYGPVVRQGPNKLVFSSVGALQAKLHRARRQLIGRILSERSMREFETTMLEQIDHLIRYIYSHARVSPHTNIDMTKRARLLGFDLAALLAFGHDLHLQTEERNRFVLPMLEAGFFWSSVFLHWPATHKFSLGLVALPVFRRLRSQYLSLSKAAQHDLYSVVADELDSSEPGSIREGELWAEATVFLPAAGDTTKTAIAALFFYLSRNPRCYKKLADEIRSRFRNGGEIHEALRMSPPVPGILWREPYASDRPFTVDGHVVLPGTTVGVNIYSLHYNEEYFPEASVFNPERWLAGGQAVREAFVPFSTGPRGCAGKAMAYLEISIFMAKVLWYFDFGLAESEKARPRGVFKLRDNFTSSHDGPCLDFRPREDVCGELRDIYAE